MDEGGSNMEAIQQTGAVAAVLTLLLLTLWWLRRRGVAGLTLGRKTTGRRLENLERLPLGPQHALHLVRLGASALLISSSPAGCALIHRSEWREIDAAGKTDQ
jgi:flagellar biogenesis protein FliO